MVKDGQLLAEFDKAYLSTEKPDYFKSLKLFEEMWKEGLQLGALPLKDPLDGIEVDIKIAKIDEALRSKRVLFQKLTPTGN
ncbi:conserved hypothetical protein [Syntrophobacter sp. SbD2]|nr:conserved hypothetical protein [Syntrophobacter sp. SbD2]